MKAKRMPRKILSAWVIILLVALLLSGYFLVPKIPAAQAATITRYPTGDGNINGTWTYSSGSTGWNLVDETSVDDNDYITSPTTTGAYYNFTSSSFSVPTGSTITNLEVFIRSKDVSTGNNRANPKIQVNNVQYSDTTANNPGTSFATYSYAWTTNPNTGSAWTVADINGTGANPLQQFGVVHSDANPALSTSWVYAVVTYDEPATLSITAPNNVTVAENSSYDITYTLTDSDSVATAAFYYDTNNDKAGGTAISGACASAAEGSSVTCSWNTTGVSPGTYYIYGVTTATPTAVSALSPGTITINSKPTLSISMPPSGNTSVATGATYNITYSLADSDDTVTAAFYYDTNNDGVGGTAITGCETKAEGTNSTCSFNTSVLTPGTPYYIYAVTSGDNVNSAVTTVSPGTITVNTTPNVPTLVLPADASYTNDNTPTLSANYSDPDTGDTGTTNYRIASTNASDCLNNANIVASGTSSATATNNENTTWTPGVSIGSNGTYYWCAQNNDGVATSAWTSMGNFILDTSTPDIVAVDAGASAADRTSLTSGSWFKYSDAGSDDQISLSWTDPSSVSDDTFYYELNASSGNTVDGTEPTTTNPYVDLITVSEGTNYFHVRPKNGAGTFGTERIFTVKYDKSYPTNVGISGIAADSTTQLTITGNAATDSGAGLNASPYWFDETTSNPGSTDSVAWQISNIFVDSGLSPNTQYTYQVKARDALANESGYSATVSKYTLANVPAAPTVSNPAFTTIKVLVNENSNPSNTQYAIYETSTGKYIDHNDGSLDLASEDWQSYANWGGASGITVNGLAEGTTYTFEVKARNGDNTETTFGSTANGTTLVSDIAPDAPTSLAQYKSDCSTPLSTGGWTNETSVCLKGYINDADTNDQVKLETEVTSGAFTNTPNFTAAGYITDPNTSSVSVTGLSSGSQYRWQARSIDDSNVTSFSFAQFNSGNLSFGVDTSAPSGGSINYTNGYQANTSVSLTAADGTDSASGVNTGTRIIKRKSATLTNGSCGTFDSFATITPTGTYPNYADSTVVSGNCYQYQYLVSDNVGNQATYDPGYVVKIDTTAPSGGSITYANGYEGSGTVALTVADGTDSVSGINASSRTVQRKSATLSGGVCGTYTSFATISQTGTYPNFTDATITSDKCYQYQYLVADNAGNQVTYTLITNTVKVDTAGPTDAGISSIATDSKTQLTITANIPTDSPSGLSASPYWFNETTGNSGATDSAAWQASNVFIDSGLSANTQYTYQVKAQDGANNESAFSATMSKYTLANQVTSLSAANTSTKDNYTLDLSWTNQGQSGIKIEQDTGCNGYDSTIYDNASSTPSSPRSISVAANTCYKFRISAYNGDGTLNTQDAIPESNQITTPPSQPTGLTHTANTASSITWDWNDVSGAAGYKVYKASDDTLLQTISSATSEWSQGSLSSDTQYSVYVRATNANGTGIASISASAYTSADIPAAPDHSDNTTSSITWNWTSGGNQKDFYAWTTTPAANSDWIIGTSWLQNSLSANSLYQFFVKARNEQLDETSSATASKYTSQNTPSGISFGTVTTNSITLSAQGTLPNLSSNSSGLYFINNTAAQNSGWIQTNSWNNSALSPNTQYAYQVKARNGDADESSSTAEETKYTLANIPGTPTLSGADYNTMQVTLDTNSNPAATEFAIYETSTGKYVDAADGSLDLSSAQWHTYAGWGGASGITVTGLSPNLTYTFKIKARNGENVETALGAGASLATLQMPVPPNAPTLILPADNSFTNDTTPTLVARYWDNNMGDTGTTSFRLTATSLAECTSGSNILASTTSAETATNDESVSWTIASPLNTDQAYYWCAQNNDGTDTSAWTAMGTFTLDTTGPTGATVSLSGIAATSITAQAPGASDSGSGLNAATYYFSNSTKATNSGWQAGDSWTSSGLTPNTTYSFQVRLRDKLANESAFSAAESAVTLANLPTGLALSTNSTSQITASWTKNSNPTGTEYYIENVTAGNDSGWITGTSWASASLQPDTLYTFRVKARNSNGDETGWTAEVSKKTLSVATVLSGNTGSDSNDDHHHHHDDSDQDETATAIDQAINQAVTNLPNYVANLPNLIDEKLNGENEIIPKEAPLAFQGNWDLLPAEPLEEFLSAYPAGLQETIAKFSDFPEISASLGINNLSQPENINNASLDATDFAQLEKMINAPFALPGLNDLVWNGKNSSLPVAALPKDMKKKLPAEVLMAQMAEGKIDLPIYVSLNEQGSVTQKITAISGKKVTLILKPSSPADSVKGYLLFRAAASTAPDPAQYPASPENTAKSLLFAPAAMAAEPPANSETRLMTSEFEFTDPDKDGIFEAEIKSPVSEGEYEIVTVINYKNPSLGQKELRLITVVDPEGYIYRKVGEDELRVKNATATLYVFNNENNSFVMWPGSEFHQENPQITDNTGKYSFLVPPGKYYIKVTSPGYADFVGQEFMVAEGNGVHQNIELSKKFSLSDIDWKTGALILVIGLLGLNFWRDRKREKNGK